MQPWMLLLSSYYQLSQACHPWCWSKVRRNAFYGIQGRKSTIFLNAKEKKTHTHRWTLATIKTNSVHFFKQAKCIKSIHWKATLTKSTYLILIQERLCSSLSIASLKSSCLLLNDLNFNISLLKKFYIKEKWWNSYEMKFTAKDKPF